MDEKCFQTSSKIEQINGDRFQKDIFTDESDGNAEYQEKPSNRKSLKKSTRRSIKFQEEPMTPKNKKYDILADQQSRISFLKNELFQSSKALQENIQISYMLLNEVKRLDNLKIDLIYDKERLSTKNQDLADENLRLRQKLQKLSSRV
ncbi:unnamed protein product [Moneuplotes crassus]|uniref:Uncharacterized protein n=1 Tax=Euplotes crassus TaxID=5936 RepID=A0AAD1UD42_EUPCR|nr:unnamed protein product [Moneuplotes crassus]